MTCCADVYEKKREFRNKLNSRRIRQRTDHFDSHAVSTEKPHSRCSNRWSKRETAENARDGYGRDGQMTKEKVNDGRRGEERRQNAISNRTASILMPYSDARSINIQLHQNRVALSILLPFSHSLPMNTRSRTFPLVQRVGERWKRKKRGGRVDRVHVSAAEHCIYVKSTKV